MALGFSPPLGEIKGNMFPFYINSLKCKINPSILTYF